MCKICITGYCMCILSFMKYHQKLNLINYKSWMFFYFNNLNLRWNTVWNLCIIFIFMHILFIPMYRYVYVFCHYGISSKCNIAWIFENTLISAALTNFGATELDHGNRLARISVALTRFGATEKENEIHV